MSHRNKVVKIENKDYEECLKELKRTFSAKRTGTNSLYSINILI